MTDGKPFKGPHQGRPVLYGGADMARARGAMILLHGRGAGAQDVLALAQAFDEPQFLYAAPEAADGTWYPHDFTAPVKDNEPGLSSALHVIDDLFKRFTAEGMPPEKVVLLGFSQGGCLALEYAARNPRRYGGIAGFSGALIGPPEVARPSPGTLGGTPVFLGCSESDPHVPADHVRHAAEVLGGLGAEVTLRLYPNLGHEVNDDEIQAVQRMIEQIEAIGGSD